MSDRINIQTTEIFDQVIITATDTASVGVVIREGLQGQTGLQGTPGGITGVQGITGVIGLSGVQGITGAGGIGGTGLQGPTGAQGITGLLGLTGLQGVPGGITGVQGITGFDGITGSQGPQGITGLGFQGITGAIGAEGITGANGLTGSQGLQGITGSIGAQGITGSIGADGVTGANGLTGAQGVQGITGAIGADGVTGVNGITGANGIQGVTGSAGAQGITGAIGADGVTGANGVQGITGNVGTQGTTGVNGITGSQGIPGITGSSGLTGITYGSTGVQGATGLVGANGVTGVQGIPGVGVIDVENYPQYSFMYKGETTLEIPSVPIKGSAGFPAIYIGEPQTPVESGYQVALTAQYESQVTYKGAAIMESDASIYGIMTTYGALSVQGGITGITLSGGATGLQGITGLPGTQGATGLAGTDGSQGITGLVGASGIQGQTGVQGLLAQSVLNDIGLFTGFLNPSGITISYDSTARTVTLTGASITSYWRGNKVLNEAMTWTSDAHTDTAGTWFLSYNGSAYAWSNSGWAFDQLQIAIVNYGTTDKFGIRESHGLMDWESHQEFHQAIGTYRQSGGTLNGYVLDGTTDADNRPGVDQTVVWDEDLPTTIPALTDGGPYTCFNLNGAGATAVFTLNNANIGLLSGGNPAYNQYTGGAWTQTVIGPNNYMNIWVVAVPVTSDTASQAYRYLWVQGQKEFNSLSTAQAEDPRSLNLGSLAALSPEYTIIAQVTIMRTGSLTGSYKIMSVQSITGSKAAPISASVGAQGVTGIQGVTGLGLTTQATADTATIGNELIAGDTFNVTAGWAGDFASGFTHTSGTTTVTGSSTYTVDNVYQMVVTISSRTVGSVTITAGGISSGSLSANATTTIQRLARATTVLTITPSTDFNGTVVVSMKLISPYAATSTFYNVTGMAAIELRANISTSNLLIGDEAGKYLTVTGTNNTCIGTDAGRNLTSGRNNLAIGYQSLLRTSNNNNNVAIGHQTLLWNQADNNVAIGYQCLYNSTGGTSNVAIGTQVGYNVTTANQMVGIGYNALGSLTTGADNVGIGYNAANATTSGASNTAIGSRALALNQSGANNVAIGQQALNNCLAGNNVAVGWQASYVYRGVDSVAVGYRSLFTNITGLYNTAVGTQALTNSTADSNTAVGYQAGQAATLGGLNTVVGDRAMYANTTGVYNTIIGGNAMYTNRGSYNTVIGTRSAYNIDNCVNNVVVGDRSQYQGATGCYNVFVGSQVSYEATRGSNNIAIGYQAAYNGLGSNNTLIGDRVCQEGSPGSNKLVLDAYGLRGSATGTYTNALVFGTAAAATADQYLRINANITTPSLAGTGTRAVYSDENGMLTNSSSDRTLKTNIKPIDDNLKKVMRLAPISFNWIDSDKKGSQTEIGLIAQEVQMVVPEVVGKNFDGTLSLDYPKLVAVLIGAIQEQQVQIDNLKKGK